MDSLLYPKLFDQVVSSKHIFLSFNPTNHLLIKGTNTYISFFPYENHCKCYKKLVSILWPMLFTLKACVRYFLLFLKDKCISSLVRTKYIEKKFNLQLFFLPTVSWTFILSRATTRYAPPWNFLSRKNNCMCNRDNARDVAACADE